MKDVNILIQGGIDVNKSLELFGDMESYDATLEDFLNMAPQKLKELEKYKEVADMTNYSILAHSLKSDSRYLGFTALAEICLNHEMKSKENDMVFVYQNFDQLVKEANRIIVLVQKYLGKEPSEVTLTEKVVTDKSKKILVVDDSNIIRNLITKFFDNEYEVLTANDGKEALEIISANMEHPLYGILLDLYMPSVNGFAVLEYFKNQNLFSKIPVAIITGDDSRETVQKVFSYPIVDVLNKPFNERDIKRVVTSMINFHQ